MIEIKNWPLYLIKFDDAEVPDETMFGAEVANKRFEQISGNWNAHLFVKVASNSRDDACSGSNAKLASDYDALAAQRDEGLAREELMLLGYEQCKQRLAEAEKLANALMDEYDNSHRDARPFNAGPLLDQCRRVLASPGCAVTVCHLCHGEGRVGGMDPATGGKDCSLCKGTGCADGEKS